MVYNNSVLIIDDEEDICNLISDVLKDEGFNCITARNSTEAIKHLNKFVPSLILLDIWLQNSDLDGLGVLEVVKRKYPSIPVVIISGHGTIEIAVNSIKMGAYDYIEKPFTSDKLVITAKRAKETLVLRKENTELKKKITKRSELIGASQAVSNLRAFIDKIAHSASRILIEGEFGTGRELVAKTIHKKSNKHAPFIRINSSVLANERLQKEIFSDANSSLKILDMLNNGTLFINEISNLPLYIQHKILKLIKEQHLKGNSKSNIKIIASTSTDLRKEIKKGNFLQDLYYRLSATQVAIPSLRERRDDILELCTHFLNFFGKNSNLDQVTVSPGAAVRMHEYDWPGNIKQLKNTIEWLMILAKIQGKKIIDVNMLPPQILNKDDSINILQMGAEVMSIPLRKAREMFERKYLQAQMARFNNNISRTSLFVGMERSALHRKLKLLNVYTNEKLEDEKISLQDLEVKEQETV